MVSPDTLERVRELSARGTARKSRSGCRAPPGGGGGGRGGECGPRAGGNLSPLRTRDSRRDLPDRAPARRIWRRRSPQCSWPGGSPSEEPARRFTCSCIFTGVCALDGAAAGVAASASRWDALDATGCGGPAAALRQTLAGAGVPRLAAAAGARARAGLDGLPVSVRPRRRPVAEAMSGVAGEAAARDRRRSFRGADGARGEAGLLLPARDERAHRLRRQPGLGRHRRSAGAGRRMDVRARGEVGGTAYGCAPSALGLELVGGTRRWERASRWRAPPAAVEPDRRGRGHPRGARRRPHRGRRHRDRRRAGRLRARAHRRRRAARGDRRGRRRLVPARHLRGWRR